MRTAAWETVAQIALRYCSKQVRGFGSGGLHTIKHVSYKRFSTSHKKLMSP